MRAALATHLLPDVGRRGTPADVGAEWEPDTGILVVRLAGRPTADDVERWEASVQDALGTVPPQAPLRVLADLHGYAVDDVSWAVHRRQREVVPRLLLQLGHRGGHTGLLEAPPEAAPGPSRVLAVAHVFRDRDKVRLYELALSRRDEKYFTDPAAARRWLRSFRPGGRVQ